jgi:putative NADH-flavin reductase
MRILVVGATGGTGLEIVREALVRGHEVTAFVRRPGRLDVDHERVRESVGDVRDGSSVRAAVAGQEAVLSALGHKRWFYPNDILSGGTRTIVEAMRAEGVRRLICETSLGVGDSFGKLGLYYTLFTIPFVLPFYYWDKGRQERVIRASGLDWTIVRPAVLTNGPARGRYRHGPEVGSYVLTRRVSRADVAAFMLDQLTDSTYARAAPGIAG